MATKKKKLTNKDRARIEAALSAYRKHVAEHGVEHLEFPE